MKTIIAALLGIFLGAIACRCSAADWTTIWSTDGETTSIDAETLEFKDQRATYWIKYDTPAAPRGGIASVIAQELLDCAGKRRRILYVASYDAAGKTLASEREGLWNPIVPGSRASMIAKAFCGAAPAARPAIL